MSLVEVDQGMLDRLRALRLWHWQERGRHRESEAYFKKRLNPKDNSLKQWQIETGHKMAQANADFHLSQVQALNDFFPLGDTAENDEVKNEKR